MTHGLRRPEKIDLRLAGALRHRGRGQPGATILARLGRLAMRAVPRRRVDPARATNETPEAPVRAVLARQTNAIAADPRRADPVKSANETRAVPVHAVRARLARETREAPVLVDQAHR